MKSEDKRFLIDKKFDYIVCMCMGISYSRIIRQIASGALTFSDLYDILGVSSGCGSCKVEVKKILKQELEKLEKMQK